LKPQKGIKNLLRFHYESGCAQSNSTEHIVLGSAYSDTAAMPSYIRRSRYV